MTGTDFECRSPRSRTGAMTYVAIVGACVALAIALDDHIVWWTWLHQKDLRIAAVPTAPALRPSPPALTHTAPPPAPNDDTAHDIVLFPEWNPEAGRTKDKLREDEMHAYFESSGAFLTVQQEVLFCAMEAYVAQEDGASTPKDAIDLCMK